MIKDRFYKNVFNFEGKEVLKESCDILMSHWSDKESYHKIFNDKIEHIKLDLERPNKLRLNFCDYMIGVSSNIEVKTNTVFVVMEDERSGLI